MSRPAPGHPPAARAERAEGHTPAVVRTRGTVVIDIEACKGCDLCIDACPPGVLRMTTSVLNERGYRYPVLFEGCTACKACSQICPDFVFQVYKYEEPIERVLPPEGGPDHEPSVEAEHVEPEAGRQERVDVEDVEEGS